MGRFIQKASDMVSSNQMRVNFLAINFELAKWLHEVVHIVLCCGCRQKSRGTSWSVVLLLY
jgi:hypothetical protein